VEGSGRIRGEGGGRGGVRGGVKGRGRHSGGGGRW